VRCLAFDVYIDPSWQRAGNDPGIPPSMDAAGESMMVRPAGWAVAEYSSRAHERQRKTTSD